MTKYKYHLQELQAILDELEPDIDNNGNPDFDMRLASALEYFIPILEASQ